MYWCTTIATCYWWLMYCVVMGSVCHKVMLLQIRRKLKKNNLFWVQCKWNLVLSLLWSTSSKNCYAFRLRLHFSCCLFIKWNAQTLLTISRNKVRFTFSWKLIWLHDILWFLHCMKFLLLNLIIAQGISSIL